MTRLLPLSTLIAAATLCGAAITSATAQDKPKCGVAAYSAAEQRYVTVPCTAAAPKVEAGQKAPCGPVAYSAAEQRYVGVPCPH